MRRALFALIMAGSFILVSCGHQSNAELLLGKWQFNDPRNPNADQKRTVTFNKDSSIVSFVGLEEDTKGTYRVSKDGKSIFLETSSGTRDTVTITLLNDAYLKIMTTRRPDTMTYTRVK